MHPTSETVLFEERTGNSKIIYIMFLRERDRETKLSKKITHLFQIEIDSISQYYKLNFGNYRRQRNIIILLKKKKGPSLQGTHYYYVTQILTGRP